MSVQIIDIDELVNLAVVAVRGSLASDSGRRLLHRNLATLAAYSEANCKAFVHSYPDEACPPLTVKDLLEPACQPRSAMNASTDQARRTLALLHYNAIARDGTDFLDAETAKGLLGMATRLL